MHIEICLLDFNNSETNTFLPSCIIFCYCRDIPMPLVNSGVKHGNLRELALARMKDLGTQCRDVRTREVGIQQIHNKIKPHEVRRILCVFSYTNNLYILSSANRLTIYFVFKA